MKIRKTLLSILRNGIKRIHIVEGVSDFTPFLTELLKLRGEQRLNSVLTKFRTLQQEDSENYNTSVLAFSKFLLMETDPILQQRRIALEYSFSEEQQKYVLKLFQTCEFQAQIAELMPELLIRFFDSHWRLSDKEKLIAHQVAPFSKLNFIFPMSLVVRQLGLLLYDLIVRRLQNDNIKITPINDIEEFATKAKIHLGRFLLNVFLGTCPEINIINLRNLYVLDFSQYVEALPQQCASLLTSFERLPITFLPLVSPTEVHTYKLTETLPSKSEGLKNKREGTGIRVIKILNRAYFRPLEIMEGEIYGINENVLFLLNKYKVIPSNHELTPEETRVWNVLYPPRKPMIKHSTKFFIRRTPKNSTMLYHEYEWALTENTLAIASLLHLSKVEFSFSYFFDSRNRIYCSQEILNFFNGDLSRALISFHENETPNVSPDVEKVLNPILIYGKRFFAKDTIGLSTSAYLKFINEKSLDKLVDEYLYQGLWTTSSSKFQFLAWLFEVKNIKESLEKNIPFKPKMVYFFDMQCSGIQLLTLISQGLSTNEVYTQSLFYNLNLLPVTDLNNEPSRDLYLFLITKFLASIKTQDLSDDKMKLISFIQNLPKYRLRKLAKPYLMKLTYQASSRTSVRDVISELKSDLAKLFGKKNYKDIFIIISWFIKIFEKFLRETYLHSIFSFNKRFLNIWKKSLKILKPRYMNLPIFRQDEILRSVVDYRKQTDTSFQFSSIRGNVYELVQYTPTKMFTSKMSSSILAHIVHCVDSVILTIALCISESDSRAEKQRIKAVIHDCIGGAWNSRTSFNEYYLSAYKFFFFRKR